MTRWLLRTPHYLNVPEMPDGTKVEWEHKETNRTTGKAVRKMHHVPLLLNPEDANDCNRNGECVVCHEGKGEPSDYIFIGDPSPDMEPLDEEAEEISASMRPKWDHPIDSLPTNGGMNSREMEFMQQMMKSFAQEIGAQLPNQSVPSKDIDELKTLVAAQQKQIEALLANSQKGPSEPVRRV